MTVAEVLPDFCRYASTPKSSRLCALTSTSCLESSWSAASFLLNALSLRPLAIILAARRPAFLALPIATVATGTPPGIWTMLYKESTPERADVFTGTPITGKTVMAATIPGKCAAPPAPAIMHCRPRLSADLAYCTIRSGVRCAETTVHSKGMSSFFNTSQASFMHGRSLSDPIMTPTSGELLGMPIPTRSSTGCSREQSSCTLGALMVTCAIFLPFLDSALPYQ
mmetsp:Transcript_21832/g.49722  ORF Transcript_21832/g.49722 Transcript_21832/m.49722 type:complete len:225 (+) Transcript_21832:141-815(+)